MTHVVCKPLVVEIKYVCAGIHEDWPLQQISMTGNPLLASPLPQPLWRPLGMRTMALGHVVGNCRSPRASSRPHQV